MRSHQSAEPIPKLHMQVCLMPVRCGYSTDNLKINIVCEIRKAPAKTTAPIPCRIAVSPLDSPQCISIPISPHVDDDNKCIAMNKHLRAAL